MNRCMRQALRTTARQTRQASSGAVKADNGALTMFLGGSLCGAATFWMVGEKKGTDDKLVLDQKIKIAALEKQLNAAKANATKAEELRQLTEEYLQCTKGSEQLTGEMESMANRLKRTQTELVASRQKMDELTNENEEYLNNLTDRIQAKAQSGKQTSVSFVNAKGDLVNFRKKEGGVSVTVGNKEVGLLNKDVAYDEKAGSVKVGETAVNIPAERREIVVSQLATLAEYAGLAHNLVGTSVVFIDAAGDRVKFSVDGGKLTVTTKSGAIVPSGSLAYDKATKELKIGESASCVLTDDASIPRLQKLAAKVNFPTSL